MRWAFLGRVGYSEALDLQATLRARVREGEPDTLLLLEHPRVITLGRSARGTSNVLVSEEERQRRGVDLVHVSRGGDVTYHGPGQLVGYPIRRIGRKVRRHVQGMAGAVVRLLSELGIASWWQDGHPGVWTEQGKIAAVGVDARGGVTSHGFALNVHPVLSDFEMIVPCGLHAPCTSIAAILGPEATPDLACAAAFIARALADEYGTRAEQIRPTQLWGGRA